MKQQTKNKENNEKRFSLYYKPFSDDSFDLFLKCGTYEQCYLHIIYLERMERYLLPIKNDYLIYANQKHSGSRLSRVSFVYGDVHFDNCVDGQYLILEDK